MVLAAAAMVLAAAVEIGCIAETVRTKAIDYNSVAFPNATEARHSHHAIDPSPVPLVPTEQV
jgi:hypothetical protein